MRFPFLNRYVIIGVLVYAGLLYAATGVVAVGLFVFGMVGFAPGLVLTGLVALAFLISPFPLGWFVARGLSRAPQTTQTGSPVLLYAVCGALAVALPLLIVPFYMARSVFTEFQGMQIYLALFYFGTPLLAALGGALYARRHRVSAAERPPARALWLSAAVMAVVYAAFFVLMGEWNVIFYKLALERERMTPLRAHVMSPAQKDRAAALLKQTQDWQVIVRESFDNRAQNWTHDPQKRIADGKYNFALQGKGYMDYGLPEIKNLSDFAASIEVKRVGGANDCGYGLTYRNQAPSRADANYAFYVLNDRSWQRQTFRSRWSSIAESDTTFAIQPDAVNRITVIGQNQHFTFFINDQLVLEAQEDELTGGKVGAAIRLGETGEDCLVEFDNFILRAP